MLKAISIALLSGYYDYALEILGAAGAWLQPGERATIEQRVRRGGARRSVLASLPGGRRLAAALRRLSRISLPPDDAWSFSRGRVGNDD